MGSDEADTLMSLLPPVGWADVATKQDLAHLEIRIKGELHAELLHSTRTFVTWLLASQAATVAVVGGLIMLA